MDQLTTEVLQAIDKLKKNEESTTIHMSETMELLLIASLLEEENISVRN